VVQELPIKVLLVEMELALPLLPELVVVVVVLANLVKTAMFQTELVVLE
jgi:hypothetical protein